MQMSIQTENPDGHDTPDGQRGAAAGKGYSRRRPDRRGVAVLVVMALLAATLSLCYALLNSQGTAGRIQSNGTRQTLARQAALTGISVAMGQMNRTAQWTGADSVLVDNITATESYEVTFATGDPRLTSSDLEWPEYPFRVTLTSKGFSQDPTGATSAAVHTVRAIVRLAPRNKAAEPSDWNTFLQYTLFQGQNEDVEIDLPVRIQGPVRLQGTLTLAQEGPDSSDPRNQYLEDLEELRQAGYFDHRPFDGPVHCRFSTIGSSGYTRLNQLGVSVVNTSSYSVQSDWQRPTGLTTYRLYSGGKSYSVETVSGELKNQALGPDMETNPLGIFYCNSTLTIDDNVTVQGTLICRDDLKIEGTNVTLSPVTIVSADGNYTPMQLPVISADDVEIQSNATGSIQGFIAAFDDFNVESGTEDAVFQITGHVVVAQEFTIEPRVEWESNNWSFSLFLFNVVGASSGPNSFFPVWVDSFSGRHSAPWLTIAQQDPVMTYHWHKPAADTPVYIAGTGDNGLRWTLLDWAENP